MSLTFGQTSNVWHRLAWIVAFALTGAALASLLIFLERPMYEAHSSIEVGPECSSSVDSESFLATQADLLQSDNLISAANQHIDPAIEFPKPLVDRAELSHIIHIRSQSPNPQQSADFVNALVDAYVADRALRLSASWGSIAGELKTANSAQRESETKLREFANVHKIPATPSRKDLAQLDSETRSQYSTLMRELEDRRRNRDHISAQLKSVTAPADSVRVIDRAEPAVQPVGRNRKLKLLLGLILGALFGLLANYAMPRFSPGTNDAEEQPIDTFWPSARSFEYPYTEKEAAQPHSEFDQLIGNLARQKSHQLLAVTSAGSSEMPIALATALTDHSPQSKLLVIDCDLAGTVTECVGLTGEKGLSDFLVDSSEEAPVHPTTCDRIDIIGTGTMPHRLPTMLKFAARETLAQFRDQYNFVLLAAPPVLTSDEMRTLAPIVDGVVLVSSEDSRTEEAKAKIESWGGKIAGVTSEAAASTAKH